MNHQEHALMTRSLEDTSGRQLSYGHSSASETLRPPRSIGGLIREARNLSDEQVEQILLYQRKNDLKFGEAAVALQLASGEDVRRALSFQFDYPYGEARVRSLSSELVVAAAPFSPAAEAFRDLRSKLLGNGPVEGEARRALAVVSPDQGDGKTFVAANLAIAFSQLGLRTLIVDADLRSPRVHKMFEVPDRVGLSNVLAGLAHQDFIYDVPGLPSLYVLPAGIEPPNPNELIAKPGFTLLLRDLLQRFDQVIVDTPAASLGADARITAMKAGSCLVVSRRHGTKVKSLKALLEAVDKSPTALAGVMLNDR